MDVWWIFNYRSLERKQEREGEEGEKEMWIDNYVKMRASRSADKTYNNKSRSASGHDEARSLKYILSFFISEPRKITYLIVTLQ